MSAPGPRRATVPSPAQTEWRTPPWLFGLLDEEFAFTLDAAADHANHLCPRSGGSVVIVWRPGVMAGPWAPPRVVLWEAGE